MSTMMVQGTEQFMSIACDVAFSQIWKAPLFTHLQNRTTPLGELQQWSITSLLTILMVNDGTPSVFGDHLTAYRCSSRRAHSGRDECNRSDRT